MYGEQQASEGTRGDHGAELFKPYPGQVPTEAYAWVLFRKVSFVKGTKEVVWPGRLLTRHIESSMATGKKGKW